MNKFFKFLSGRPKSVELKECIKPYIFYPQLIFCVYLVYLTVKTGHVFYGLMTIFLAWQMGWGMSIERFYKSEERKDRDDK